MDFETYEEAVAYARTEARRTGIARGIVRVRDSLTLHAGRPWQVFMLPRPANRTGYELRCEAIEA